MSRLTIDISDHQHQSLKALAALQGKSIRQYALERLFPTALQESGAWQELKAMLEGRISDGLSGEVSSLSFDAIVEDELARNRSA